VFYEKSEMAEMMEKREEKNRKAQQNDKDVVNEAAEITGQKKEKKRREHPPEKEGAAYKFRTGWLWGVFAFCIYFFFKNPPVMVGFPGYFSIVGALLFCFPPIHRLFLRYDSPISDTVTRTFIVIVLLVYYAHLLENVPPELLESVARQ